MHSPETSHFSRAEVLRRSRRQPQILVEGSNLLNRKGFESASETRLFLQVAAFSIWSPQSAFRMRNMSSKLLQVRSVLGAFLHSGLASKMPWGTGAALIGARYRLNITLLFSQGWPGWHACDYTGITSFTVTSMKFYIKKWEKPVMQNFRVLCKSKPSEC